VPRRIRGNAANTILNFTSHRFMRIRTHRPQDRVLDPIREQPPISFLGGVSPTFRKSVEALCA
jgi:hypothetical protein